MRIANKIKSAMVVTCGTAIILSVAYGVMASSKKSPSPKADIQSLSFTGGIPGGINVTTGEVYYKAQFSFFYGSGPVILSANSDKTGDTFVDDVLIIKVVRPDGSTAIFKNDYSRNCSGPIVSLPPKDISKKFAPGLNKVFVTMQDRCGGGVASSAMWLNN